MYEISLINVIENLQHIKEEVDMSGEVSIHNIIDNLSQYSKNDLLHFRDCIDLVLIHTYNK